MSPPKAMHSEAVMPRLYFPVFCWFCIMLCSFITVSTRWCTKSFVLLIVHLPLRCDDQNLATPLRLRPSHDDNTERRKGLRSVCECVCVHMCTLAFGSADSVHVQHTDTPQFSTGNHRKQSFDAISISIRNDKQGFFFKNSMSPMAYMLSIGSLQTPSCSGGGTTLKTKTMFKKRNTFERVSGAFCALSPHCVFQTTTPADSAALALESSTKTITETFPTYFFLSISCFCYASPPLLSSSSN